MARLQTLLQALSEFADADVTQGNFRILDRGSAPYAVIYPGGFEVIQRSDSGREMVVRWRHYVEVFATFLDDSYSNIEAAREAVLDQLHAYPQLNGLKGILRAYIESGEDLRFLYPPAGDIPAFVFVRLTHLAEEYVNYGGTGEFE
jgi:hypothetical protein